jgi:hypothetical protein
MTDRKKPGVAFWATIVVVAGLVGYPLGIGPACWFSSRLGGTRIVSQVYRPLTWTAEFTDSDPLMNGIQWYCELGSTDLSQWDFAPDNPGNAEWISGAELERMGVL